MSAFEQFSSSMSTAGRRVPFLQMTTAFSLSPSSPPSSPPSDSDSKAMICPLRTLKCEQKCGNEDFNIVDHLVRDHHAQHFDAVFDENGISDIQFETSIPLIETVFRRTAILLSLPSGEVLCWSMETKRRGDGELQASSSIQIVERPSTVSSPHSNMSLIGETSKQTTSIDLIREDSASSKVHCCATNMEWSRASTPTALKPATTTTTTTVGAAFSDSTSSPRQEASTEEYEILYNATIRTETCENCKGREQQQQQNCPCHRQWDGVISSSRSSFPHEYLVSHGRALVLLHPTHSESFIPALRKQRDGTMQAILCIPLTLRLRAVNFQK